jgi:hypothetical protein
LTVYDNLIKNSRLFFFVFFCLSLFFVVYCCCCFFFFFFCFFGNGQICYILSGVISGNTPFIFYQSYLKQMHRSCKIPPATIPRNRRRFCSWSFLSITRRGREDVLCVWLPTSKPAYLPLRQYLLEFSFLALISISGKIDLVCWFRLLNATFSNISVISWRSVLLVEKPEYQEKTTILTQVTD